MERGPGVWQRFVSAEKDLSLPSCELVVAHYRESLAWLRRVPRSIGRRVYHKDPEAAGAGVILPNVGREADTYLTHIIERWDSLAEVTVFCQGHPFDHAHDFHASLRRIAEQGLGPEGFEWFGFILDSDDPRGRRLFVPWSKNPERLELPGPEFFAAFLDGQLPQWFRFRPGAQFAVSVSRIRGRPLEYWVALRKAVRVEELYPHCLERTWDRVFGLEAISAKAMGGGETLYLKRVKRLGPGSQSPAAGAAAGCPL